MYFPGKLRAEHDGQRNVQFAEQPPDARDAPIDRVLTKGLVHKVRVAGRHVRPIDRTLTEAELLDEERKADGDLLAARPSRDMNRLAREAGHRIGRLLR